MAKFRFRHYWFCILVSLATTSVQAQTDTIPKRDTTLSLDTVPGMVHPDSIVAATPDTTLRILNLNPYITLHVDSAIVYNLDINRGDSARYFWFLKNAPVGLKINKDEGILTFKAEKSFFLSGRLKYDQEYRVHLGVQNLSDPMERVDTFFTLLFYNTEITLSQIKPTISSTVIIEEGDTLSFSIQCENGNFPIESITTLTNMPIKGYASIQKCNDQFVWPIPYDFVRDTDSAKVRVFNITLIGSDKFYNRDTSIIRVVVRDALNYPFRLQEYQKLTKDISLYILQLKFTFKELDKKVRGTKKTRTSFDLLSGTSALSGTILSTSTSESSKNAGKVMPSVGVALVPVKEAVSPVKTYEQNSAAQVRTSIKRLEYSLQDNALSGELDADILTKINKLRGELKQVQVSLIDVPMVDTGNLSEDELNNYFNNPKVNKKYKLSKN